MRAASSPAFFELSTPTQPTGTPGGIWAIASSASSPSRTLFSDRSGTPITGRSVWAAATPGSAAASPAPAMITLRPRSFALRQYSATASGVRWAERTSSSWAIPRSLSTSTAPCMRSTSDSEPTRMPTSGRSAGDMLPRPRVQRDVLSIAGARERDALDSRVGMIARFLDRSPDAGDVQDPPAVGDEPVAAERSAGMEDERARRLRRFHAVDRRARIALFRIAAGGHGDRHRCALRRCEGHAGQITVRGGRERHQKISFQARKDHLGLGIAEAAVELEHPRAVLGQDHPGVEATCECAATLGELGDHRLDHKVHELVSIRCVGHRRITAHAARVGPRIAVSDPAVVPRLRKRHDSAAVRDGEDRQLWALQELLDHDLVAERRGGAQSRVELVLGLADEDSLPSGKPICLDHTWGPRDRERLRGRNARGAHHLLGEGLRTFDAGGLAAGAEDGDARIAEVVGDSVDERRLRPDDNQVDVELACQPEQPLSILRPDWMAVTDGRNPGIAGRRVELRELRAVAQLPREGVLTATRSDEKDLHGTSLLAALAACHGFEAARREHALALGARADQRDLDAQLALHELDVTAGVLREPGDVLDRVQRPLPAGQRLVHGPAVVEVALVRRKLLRLAPVGKHVANADRELGERREHVELRQRKRRHPVQADGVAQADDVEPAAAPFAAGDGPVFAAELAQALLIGPLD